MVDSKTDFFQLKNHFLKIAHVKSVALIKANLTFTPEVSIVIPAYKRPDLLKESIEAALSQEGNLNFEVIVVDDDPNMDDKTEELIKSISDVRLSYYKNEKNVGAYNNLNRCFELATAKWVVMIHDDDLLLSFFLKDCMKVVNEQPQIGILKPSWYNWYDDGKKLIVPEVETTNSLSRIYEISHLISAGIGAPTGIVVNREKFFLVGGFNQDFFPSADKCFITLFSYYFEVYKLDKVASVYRWLANDSLRVEILAGFFTNDYYLYKYLFKHIKIPNIFADNYLNYAWRNIVGYYKGINPDFEFDKSTLGLKEPKSILVKIAYKLTEHLVKIYCKFYKVFENQIYKRRQFRLAKLTAASAQSYLK
jgi:glycosyltransferase involved in cell wall biosynthesis